MDPDQIELTKSGLIYYDLYDKLLKDRIIFLTDEIDSKKSSDIIASLLFLNTQSKTKEITIYINSSGGSLEDLFAIYDCIQFIKAPVKTICAGVAYSSAAVILCAGSKGKRLAFPHSDIMIHGVQVFDVSGSLVDFERESKKGKKLNLQMMKILEKHSKQELEKIINDCQTDYYLTPEEAINYGLIDKIVKYSK